MSDSSSSSLTANDLRSKLQVISKLKSEGLTVSDVKLLEIAKTLSSLNKKVDEVTSLLQGSEVNFNTRLDELKASFKMEKKKSPKSKSKKNNKKGKSKTTTMTNCGACSTFIMNGNVEAHMLKHHATQSKDEIQCKEIKVESEVYSFMMKTWIEKEELELKLMKVRMENKRDDEEEEEDVQEPMDTSKEEANVNGK